MKKVFIPLGVFLLIGILDGSSQDTFKFKIPTKVSCLASTDSSIICYDYFYIQAAEADSTAQVVWMQIMSSLEPVTIDIKRANVVLFVNRDLLLELRFKSGNEDTFMAFGAKIVLDFNWNPKQRIYIENPTKNKIDTLGSDGKMVTLNKGLFLILSSKDQAFGLFSTLQRWERVIKAKRSQL